MSVLISPKHKLVGVPFNPAVTNLFPEARRMSIHGRDTLLLPHQPAQTFMLRKMGYDVPAPILTNYDWPHPPGKPPFDVQKKTCALLTMSERAYVLNGMGTGKTKGALWAWDYLKGNKLANKVLIVAPLSTLKFTWAREAFETLPHRKVSVLHGPKEKRIERLKDPEVNIFIINHDGVKVIHEELLKLITLKVIDTLVIDELAVFRNPKSELTKLFMKLAPKLKWVWGMTGSPMPNKPTDVWAQAQIVTPWTVNKRFTHFRQEVMEQPTQKATFLWVPRANAVDTAFKALQPSVRFSLDDVVELPPLVQRTIDVEMGPNQKKVYLSLAKHCYAAFQNKEITAANAGVVLSKLLQVSTGWVYSKDKGSVVALDNSERVKAMLDIVMDADRKVIVFAPFKHALAGISAALHGEGVDHAIVSGDTSVGRRGEIFNAFQNTSKYHTLAAHPECMAHGLTLTAAATIIWFGPIFDQEIYNQANHRIIRVGQTSKQQLIHLQSTPAEKKAYAMLWGKQSMQGALLELFEQSTEDNPQR